MPKLDRNMYLEEILNEIFDNAAIDVTNKILDEVCEEVW